jgi:hypothetical protein
MQYIIEFVREQIHDTDSEQYTDQQIQDRLDMARLDLYSHKLCAADTLSSTGTYEWKDFYSKHGFWEEGTVLQAPDGTVLTPTTSEYLIGRWTFATHQNQLPMGATGRVYNVYGVCAKLLFQWENTLRNQFNFTADGLTVQRIAQVKDLHALGLTFQAMSWGSPGTQIKLVRRDIRG